MGGGFDKARAPGKTSPTVDPAASAVAPGKRTLKDRLGLPPRLETHPVQRLIDGLDAGSPTQGKAVDAAYSDIIAAARAPGAPMRSLFGRQRMVQRKDAKDDEAILENQASLKGTDVEIPALEGALLATRKEAVKLGLLSQASFDAGLALSQAMTQLQSAVAAKGAVDPGVQERAAVAAQQVFAALQRETAGDKNFKIMPSMAPGGAVTSQNPYTEEARVTTTFLFWSNTNDVGSWL